MQGFKNLLFIVLVVAVLLLIKFFLLPSPQINAPKTGSNTDAMQVSASILTVSSIDQNIFATGSILANEEVELHPEVSGKLMQIFFTEGSKVNKGDLLVKINDSDLQAQLRKNELDKKLADDKIGRAHV